MQDNYAISENQWDLVKEHLECVTVKKNEYYVQRGRFAGRWALSQKGYALVQEDFYSTRVLKDDPAITHDNFL